MIWLPLLTSLALAQSPDPLALGDDATASAPETASAPAEAPAQPAPSEPATTAPVLVAPAPRAAPPPAQATISAPTAQAMLPVDGGWLFNFAGPLVLLLGAGAGLWYIRRNGLSLGGLQLGGLKAFAGAEVEGPRIRVAARTPLAGQDVLTLVEVSTAAGERQLLVTAGPGGSRLVADLTAAGSAQASDDRLVEALRKALPGTWAAPQGLPQAAAPTPPTPVVAAAAAAPAPTPVGAAVAPMAASVAATPAAATPHVEVEPETTPAAHPTPSFSAHLEQVDEPVQAGQHHRDDGPGGVPVLQASRPTPTRADRRAAPTSTPRGLQQGRADLDDRGADWRSATYLQAADDEPPRDEDLVDVIGEQAAAFRERNGRSGTRSRRPAAGGRRGRPAGHLAQLATSDVSEDTRRFGGGGRRRSGVLREASSRQERTEAARALLEKVMAQRRGGSR